MYTDVKYMLNRIRMEAYLVLLQMTTATLQKHYDDGQIVCMFVEISLHITRIIRYIGTY